MKLLFLTHQFPYPPDSGGRIKSWTLLEHLRGIADVHLLCFQGQPFTREQAAYAAGFGDRLLTVPFVRPRSLRSLLGSYAAGLPLSVYRNYSQAMARAVKERLESVPFDALFADHEYMGQYVLPDFPGLTILHLHNVESLMWQRQSRQERDPLRRLVMALEARRLRRYEASIVQRFRKVFVVSGPEREAALALGTPPERLGVLPNVPLPEVLERPPLSFEAASPTVLYVGTLSWMPNQQGLRWFLGSCLPLLRRREPRARALVAGADAPRWLRELAQRSDALSLLSPLPIGAEEGLYRSSRVFVEPVRGGGGTKVKVLTALARGLPVVATPDGALGIDAVPGVHLLVAATAEEMAERLQGLLADPSEWRRLSNAGRALIEERYRPEVAYRPLLEALVAAR